MEGKQLNRKCCKVLLSVTLSSVLLIALSGCMKSKPGVLGEYIDYNYPYEPDSPAPAPHKGYFASEHGTMSFNGDGESVTIDFDKPLAAAVGLPAGEQKATYAFKSGDLPPHGKIPIRYDVAMYLSITAGSQYADIAVGIVSEDGIKSTGTNCTTEDRITFIDVELDGKAGVNFLKSTKTINTQVKADKKQQRGSNFDRRGCRRTG